MAHNYRRELFTTTIVTRFCIIMVWFSGKTGFINIMFSFSTIKRSINVS